MQGPLNCVRTVKALRTLFIILLSLVAIETLVECIVNGFLDNTTPLAYKLRTRVSVFLPNVWPANKPDSITKYWPNRMHLSSTTSGLQHKRKRRNRRQKFKPKQLTYTTNSSATSLVVTSNTTKLRRKYAVVPNTAYFLTTDEYPIIIEDEQIEDKQIEDQQIEDQQIEDQQIEDQQMEDKQIEDQQIEDQQIEDKQIEDQQIEDQQIEDKRIEDQQIEDKQIEDQQIDDKQIEDQQTLEIQTLASTTTRWSSSLNTLQTGNDNIIYCEPDLSPNLLTPNKTEISISQLDGKFPDVTLGGRFTPTNCTPRYNVAIIVPYRDREKNLAIFLNHMHPFLMKQMIEYRIFVVEQIGTDPFNRGKLLNLGFLEAQKLRPGGWGCFIFHDIDLLPLCPRHLYRCRQQQPVHMSAAVDKLNYKLLYLGQFGGVSAMTPEQFTKVNGFSNKYWGWGGEDDDISVRIKAEGYRLARGKMSVARYTMLKHNRTGINKLRFRLLKTIYGRRHSDGLRKTIYEIVNISMYNLYTHILADVGFPWTGPSIWPSRSNTFIDIYRKIKHGRPIANRIKIVRQTTASPAENTSRVAKTGDKFRATTPTRRPRKIKDKEKTKEKNNELDEIAKPDTSWSNWLELSGLGGLGAPSWYLRRISWREPGLAVLPRQLASLRASLQLRRPMLMINMEYSHHALGRH